MVQRIRAAKKQGCGCGRGHGLTSSGCQCGHSTLKPYIEDPSIDACGKRKRLRIQVCKPVCVTVFGLEDQRMVIDQLFGRPNCWARKPVKENGAQVFLTTDDCQVTLIKPGTYELNMEDYGLFPEDFQFFKTEQSLDTARTAAEVGSVVIS